MARESERPGALAGATGAGFLSNATKLDSVHNTPETQCLQAACVALSERSLGRKPGETADDYPHVVTRLAGKWRVIVCAGGHQWIIQRRAAERQRRAQWRATGYCLTREALVRLCVASCARIDPAAMASLLALPERIARTAHSAPPAQTVEPRLEFHGIEGQGVGDGTPRGAYIRFYAQLMLNAAVDFGPQKL
jgi:hypothetical protein